VPSADKARASLPGRPGDRQFLSAPRRSVATTEHCLLALQAQEFQ
jgi:hypothetical protein